MDVSKGESEGVGGILGSSVGAASGLSGAAGYAEV